MSVCIPSNLTSDFLGTVALDILHDSKKQYPLFSNKKLSVLTDLISKNILLHNPNKGHLKNEIKQFVFYSVLQYFMKLWQNNLLKALNIMFIEQINTWSYIQLRETVSIPLVYSNSGEYWVPVNNTPQGSLVEYQNYLYQSQDLNPIVFESLNIHVPFVDNLKNTINVLNQIVGKTNVVLDMKSQAGLIRSVCDPFGYVNTLPGKTDPGHFISGMSFIRKNSINKLDKFSYIIHLEHPNIGRLVFLNVCYENLLEEYYITILDHCFKNSLPSTSLVTKTLDKLLNNTVTEETTETVGDILHSISNVLRKDLYKNIHTLFSNDFPDDSTMIYNVITKYYCDLLGFDYEPNSFKMIDYLVELMTEYCNTKNIKILCFCYYQYNTLLQYISCPQNDKYIPFQSALQLYLNSMWLPNRKGKLVNQILKSVKNWRKELETELLLCKCELYNYIHELIQYTKKNLDIIAEFENSEINMGVPNGIPIPQFSQKARELLINYVYFYNPQLIQNNNPIIYIYSLLNTILEKKPLLKLGCKFNQKITSREKRDQYLSEYTVKLIFGKFSGDFGQIMWAMKNGYLFATEDNNASAMALILQKIPSGYIKDPNIWGSIHGLGNGSKVDCHLSVQQAMFNG